MFELKLTPAALKTLHGGARVIVADEGIAVFVRKLVGGAFTVLGVDAAGRMREEGEPATDASVPVMGLPGNLCGFILTEGTKAAYAEWGAERLLATGKRELPVLVVPKNVLEHESRILAFLFELQGQLLADTSANAAALEAQVVYLREASERMMTSLAVAARVMDSVGYEDMTPVATLKPGRHVLKGAGDGTVAFSQLLPVDGLGLAALSLFVSQAGKGSGQVTLTLRRDFDGKAHASVPLRYEDCCAGWLDVCFDEVVTDIMGDLRLDLSFEDGTGTAPQFALADERADRFGRAGDGASLALQLYKNLFKPDLPRAVAEEFSGAGKAVSLDTLPGFFPERVGFYGGAPRLAAAADEVDFAPLQFSETDGWGQAHLASDGVTGLTVALPLTRADSTLFLSVELPEAGGPRMAVSVLYVRTLDDVEGAVTALLRDGEKQSVVLCHETAVMMPASTRDFHLPLPGGSEGEGFAVVFAKSLTGHVRDGWVRLNCIRRARMLECDTASREPEGGRWLVRALRLPELTGSVTFIDGDDAHHALAASLGFSPMLLDENGGYLQTHPLKDRLSCAAVPGLLPAGTRKIVATATTGHPSAPEFVYLLAVRPQGSGDLKPAVEAAAAEAADQALQDGTLRQTGDVSWTARRLGATELARLELDFKTPLDTVHDVMFAALPIDGVNSYGWCRWTSLGIISAAGASRG